MSNHEIFKSCCLFSLQGIIRGDFMQLVEHIRGDSMQVTAVIRGDSMH